MVGVVCVHKIKTNWALVVCDDVCFYELKVLYVFVSNMYFLHCLLAILVVSKYLLWLVDTHGKIVINNKCDMRDDNDEYVLFFQVAKM